MLHTSDITAIDNYCGAGGSTTGLKSAGIRVIHAANHWKLAIDTHNTNHPEVDHSCIDLNQADPRFFPRTTIAWFSPACTWHSLAGGRKRKNQDQLHLWEKKKLDPGAERSRMQAWDVVNFTEVHRYQVVIVENVLEFRTDWEPYPAWILAMSLLGYDHQEVYHNSMFCYPNPAPQSRDRVYIVFHRRGNRKPNVTFCPPAHCVNCGEVRAIQTWKYNKRHKRFNTYGGYGSIGSRRGQYYYSCPQCREEVFPYTAPAKVAIDWSLPCPKIRDRASLKLKRLEDTTLRRIEKGLKRFAQPFFVHRGYSTKPSEDRLLSIEDPVSTLTTSNKLYLAEPFLTHYGDRGEGRTMSVHQPTPTQTTKNEFGLAVPPFIDIARNGTLPNTLEQPTATVTTSGKHHSLIQPPPFLTAYHGGREAVRSVEEPTWTVATEKQFSLVDTAFISSYYGNGGNRSVQEPAPTVRTKDGHALITPDFSDEIDWAEMVQDCGYRMLKWHEALLLQGFSPFYTVLGADDDKFKQIGNAVTPEKAFMLGHAVVESLS